jgi:hypothetical protein
LPVSMTRDGAELRTETSGGYGRSFCVLPPEIIDQSIGGNCAKAGALDVRSFSGP